MKVRLYKRPEKVGWFGWIESCKGECVGFVQMDGTILFEW